MSKEITCNISWLKHVNGNLVVDDIDEMRNATNEFAEQTSISFLKWTAKEGWREYDEPDRWHQPSESKRVITAKQLFDLYKEKNT